MNNEIGKSLKKINNLLKRSHPGCPKGHLHRLRGWMLEYLAMNEDKDVYQKDLEAEFCVRRSTATEVLKLMERDGLITREAVGSDRRLKKITLTDKSADFSREFKKRICHMEDIMSEGIPQEELKVFKDVADKIFLNLEKHFYEIKESKYD